MKIVCVEKSTGRPPKKEIKELKDKLLLFFNKYYKPTMQNEELDYTYMNTILDYLTIDILTMYENNIKEIHIDQGHSLDSNGKATIKVKFKKDEKPEMVSRLIDTYIQSMPDPKIITDTDEQNEAVQG